MTTDKVKFQLGQKVFHVLDTDLAGLVTAIVFRPNGVTYGITWAEGLDETFHYDIELTSEKEYQPKGE